MPNKAKAQEYRNAARHHLMELARTGQSQTAAGFQQGWGAGGMRAGGPAGMPGRFDVRFGQGISDADVDAFIAKMGGNPFDPPDQRQQQANMQSQSTGSIGGKRLSDRKLNDSSPMSIFREVMADYDKKYEEAFKANKDIFDKKVGLAEGLATRRQERAKNAGIAEKQDIDDRLKAELGNIRAYLAANGTDGSSMEGALAMNAATNTAREQQRVSENVDARANEYDYQDTNNLIDIYERRHDEYPDRNEAFTLADRLGQAEALRSASEARANNPIYTPTQQAPQIPWYPAPTYYGRMGYAGPVAPITTDIFGFGSQPQPQPQPAPQQVQPQQFDDYYDDSPAPVNQAMLDRLARQNADKQWRIMKRQHNILQGHAPSGPRKLNTMAENWAALMQ